MSFLSPLFLLGALAASLPILLHMLKREPEARVRFPAVRLLRRAPVEQAQHRRLRELLLLLLRVTALVFLALAFARPFFASAHTEVHSVTVIALDTSMSMSAPGTFARAQQLARDALGRAPSSSLVGVVTFGESAQVTREPTSDHPEALAAIDRARAGFGGTSYRAALASASALVSSRGNGRGLIVVITDLQESGWDAADRASISPQTRIEVVDAGAPPPNLAISGLRRSDGRLTALVRNTGPQPRDVRVALSVDDRLAGEAKATVGANQAAEVPLPEARGARAVVSIDDPEGVQGDNRRFAVLEGAGRPRVAIVTSSGDLTREGFYAQQALTATGPEGASYEAQGIAAGHLRPDSVRQSAAVVVLATRGLDQQARLFLRDYLRSGGGVLVAVGPDVDSEVLAETLGDAKLVGVKPPLPDASPKRIAPVDPRHPLFTVFGSRVSTLGLIRFARAVGLESAACGTLARFTDGSAALLECTIGSGRALVFASDLDHRWNDFPLHPSFVPFLHEAVRFLGATQRETSDHLIGEGAAGATAEPGFVTLPAEGPKPARQIAVNVDPAEADPARLTLADFDAAVIRLKDTPSGTGRSRPEEDRQQMWRYLLAMVFVVLVGESLVAARTV
jgi:von Willebrand factor type A domain/Aerotolerance regulator N-terminal